MEELEPKRKSNIFTKEFFAKYSYVFLLAILLIGGISYSYTFFTQNRKISSGSITTANLTVNFGNRVINATGLSAPTDDQEGLSEYVKNLTITNATGVNGSFKLTLNRTSGLNLSDLRYALSLNGAIQEIADVPNDGEIMSSAIMGNETIDVEVRLWPKSTYSGNGTSFSGELVSEVRYLGTVASSLSNPAGKYVNFNCSSTCEVWQIVKIESDRLVLTRQADYTGATSRTNSYRYNPSLTFNDDSMITSVSTDDKNVYLAKTVKITGGDGTIDYPYELANDEFREADKKIVAVITYKDGATTLGTQNIYYNETNYISRTMNDPTFRYWDDGTNYFVLGDTITTITSDTDLNAVKFPVATLTLTNNSVSLHMGTNGENSYTYNGDGSLSCTSSDDTKVTCSVDTTNNKIVLVPVAVTTTDVTITVSGVDGVNYLAPANQTFTVSVVPMPTITSCQGCKYTYTTNMYFYDSYDQTNATLTQFANNNDTLVDDYTTLNKNVFLGFKFDLNGNITNAYVCGIKGTDRIIDQTTLEVLNETTPGENAGTAFCIEYGSSTDNINYIKGPSLWNDPSFSIGRCVSHFSYSASCHGSIDAYVESSSYGVIQDNDSGEYCTYDEYVDDDNHYVSCGTH